MMCSLIKTNFFHPSPGSGMLGSWWFGGGPSSPDSNYLRVANAAFPNRRLSDNTLMTPKIRIAPSCASSPGKHRRKFSIFGEFLICRFSFEMKLSVFHEGGTPGGGLPIRRHSSIGPQERRASAMNLSPPTVSCFSFIASKYSILFINKCQELKIAHFLA